MSLWRRIKCFCGFHNSYVEHKSHKGEYIVCYDCDNVEYFSIPKHKRIPESGTRKYSKFFGTEIELIQYIDDNHWYFRIIGEDHTARHRAQTKWSKM